jgi:hypothetical protein
MSFILRSFLLHSFLFLFLFDDYFFPPNLSIPFGINVRSPGGLLLFSAFLPFPSLSFCSTPGRFTQLDHSYSSFIQYSMPRNVQSVRNAIAKKIPVIIDHTVFGYSTIKNFVSASKFKFPGAVCNL